MIDDMLRRGEGHIVNLTSPAGYFPLPFMLPYTAARHAVVGFSLGLREEVADRGVGVSLICPAQVNTGYFQKNDANMDWYPKISKLFPVLQPEQVAARVIDAIRHNKREVIFPFVLWLITRFYQTLPRLSLAFLKLFGLFRPSAR